MEASARAGRVLDREKNRAAPLAAGRDALAEAEDGEQDRRPDADLAVRWRQADERGRDTHERE
jgi:hypothetical protein